MLKILSDIARAGFSIIYGDQFSRYAKPMAKLLRDGEHTVQVEHNRSFGWSKIDDPQSTIVFRVEPNAQDETD